MQIRPATPQDKPAIIGLLKQSLGESTIPKSEALWSWKHEQNPFGESYVLLAEENGELIGVRAFMQWQWQWQNKTYKAIRAVDTAMHPQHMGKGIFKKLTLQQAEMCKQDGINFIFNTPNLQSKPGYLKMGWQEQGNMPLKLSLLLFPALQYQLSSKKDPDYVIPTQQWKEEIFSRIQPREQNTITTNLSPAYIQWRYAKNPLYRYYYFTDNKNYIVITRIKVHAQFRELRIADFIVTNKQASAKDICSAVKKNLLAFCRRYHIGVISLSGNQYKQYKPYFGWMGMLPVVSKGPVVTLKDLNMNGTFNSLLNGNNWSYSLGDMELF